MLNGNLIRKEVECKSEDIKVIRANRNLRQTEIGAYASVINAFRAQGPLIKDKIEILEDLCEQLAIPPERHYAELKRALNDDSLNQVARTIIGFDTSYTWETEASKYCDTLPSCVPKSRFVTNAFHALSNYCVGNILSAKRNEFNNFRPENGSHLNESLPELGEHAYCSKPNPLASIILNSRPTQDDSTNMTCSYLTPIGLDTLEETPTTPPQDLPYDPEEEFDMEMLYSRTNSYPPPRSKRVSFEQKFYSEDTYLDPQSLDTNVNLDQLINNTCKKQKLEQEKTSCDKRRTGKGKQANKGDLDLFPSDNTIYGIVDSKSKNSSGSNYVPLISLKKIPVESPVRRKATVNLRKSRNSISNPKRLKRSNNSDTNDSVTITEEKSELLNLKDSIQLERNEESLKLPQTNGNLDTTNNLDNSNVKSIDEASNLNQSHENSAIQQQQMCLQNKEQLPSNTFAMNDSNTELIENILEGSPLDQIRTDDECVASGDSNIPFDPNMTHRDEIQLSVTTISKNDDNIINININNNNNNNNNNSSSNNNSVDDNSGIHNLEEINTTVVIPDPVSNLDPFYHPIKDAFNEAESTAYLVESISDTIEKPKLPLPDNQTDNMALIELPNSPKTAKQEEMNCTKGEIQICFDEDKITTTTLDTTTIPIITHPTNIPPITTTNLIDSSNITTAKPIDLARSNVTNYLRTNRTNTVHNTPYSDSTASTNIKCTDIISDSEPKIIIEDPSEDSKLISLNLNYTKDLPLTLVPADNNAIELSPYSTNNRISPPIQRIPTKKVIQTPQESQKTSPNVYSPISSSDRSNCESTSDTTPLSTPTKILKKEPPLLDVSLQNIFSPISSPEDDACISQITPQVDIRSHISTCSITTSISKNLYTYSSSPDINSQATSINCSEDDNIASQRSFQIGVRKRDSLSESIDSRISLTYSNNLDEIGGDDCLTTSLLPPPSKTINSTIPKDDSVFVDSMFSNAINSFMHQHMPEIDKKSSETAPSELECNLDDLVDFQHIGDSYVVIDEDLRELSASLIELEDIEVYQPDSNQNNITNKYS